jgi:signal transduction histidine kinase
MIAGEKLDLRFVTPGSALAVVAVTAAGLFSAASAKGAGPWDSTQTVVLLLGVAHALFGTLVIGWIERRGRRMHLAAFFAVAVGIDLAALITSGGSAYLLSMSLMSQSVLYLPSAGAALVIGVCSIATLAIRALAAPAALDLVKHVAAFGSIAVFVVVFSRMMLEQHRARAELGRLAELLSLANQQLQSHARDVEELATTKERNRIAREIHDGLGHYLTVVHVQLEAALTLLRGDPDRARGALVKAQDLTHEGLSEVRRSVALLRGSMLANRPLVESIRRLAGECSAEGIEADVRFSGTERRLAEPIEATLYRAAQEALTNVRRHARASRLKIELTFVADDRVKLSVEDDGVEPTG